MFEIKESGNKRDKELSEIKKVIGMISEQAKASNVQDGKERDKHTHTPNEHTKKATINSTSNSVKATNVNRAPTNVARLSMSKIGGNASQKVTNKPGNNNKTPASTPTQSSGTVETPKRDINKITARQQNENKSISNKPAAKKVNKPNVSKILVKPKSSQSTEKTLADMKIKINPRDIKFNNISKRQNGSIVIECENVECRDEIKQKIEEHMSGQYELRELENMKPRIKIFGMSEQMSEDGLIELLKHQNAMLLESDIEVIKIVKDIKDDRIHNAIIQTDVVSFNKIMEAGKVFLNWDVCAVKEHFSIMRCHKCAGYDHTKEI